LTETSPSRLLGDERRETTQREALAEWVGREILPHERDLRQWLQRRLVDAADVEDIVQECYCCLAQLDDVAHVTVPRAYLFTMARNLAQRQRKRARVVRIEALAETADADWASDQPSPERFAAARQELERVQAALSTLPERARRIFLMRKVEGLTQKEIAQVMGVSEAVVENDASRSLRAILKLITEPEPEQSISSAGGARARSR
jgi:RNA polymerase sigma factor (sigma-70 family)